LRGNAAVFQRRQGVGNGVADLRSGIGAPGVFQEIWFDEFSTCSTTSMWRDSRSSPFLASISA